MVNAAALSLVDQLAERHSLSLGDYQRLIEAFSPGLAAHAAARADVQRRRYFGNWRSAKTNPSLWGRSSR